MSRYVILNDGKREVTVGWDAPLGTFFAQIFHPGVVDDETYDDDLVWAIGDEPRQVTSLDELVLALEEQGVTLNRDWQRQLREDEAAPWEPGPLQRALGFTGKEGA